MLHATRKSAVRSLPTGLLCFFCVLLLCSPVVEAGYNSPTVGPGRPFTDEEKKAVDCAMKCLEEDKNCLRDGDANKQTMCDIINCLKRMLANGKVCAFDDSTGQPEGITRPDGAATWGGDAMNINSNYLKKDDKTLEVLKHILLHEGLHTIQSGGTVNEKEKAAYCLEYWYACWRLDKDGHLNEEQKEAAEAIKCEVKERKESYCKAVAEEHKVDNYIAEHRGLRYSPNQEGLIYHQTFGSSAIIEIANIESSTAEGFINTGLDRSTDFAVFTNGAGADILVVCGVEGSGGTVLAYYDVDADGIPDEDGAVTLATMQHPFNLTQLNALGVLFVLDTEADAIYTSRLNDDGRFVAIDPAQAFARAADFPAIAELRSIRARWEVYPAGGIQLVGGDYMIRQSSENEEARLFFIDDTDADLRADNMRELRREEKIDDFKPAVTGVLQDGDQTITVMALSGRNVVVYSTDAELSSLGTELGRRSIAREEHLHRVALRLERPLQAGEYIVLVDEQTGKYELSPQQVVLTQPEILSMSEGRHFPGDIVTISGRNFGTTPRVLLAEQEMEIVASSDTEIRFLTPNISNIPINVFIVQVESAGKLSNTCAISTIPDCNENGVDDFFDIVYGTAMDENHNEIPDDCEALVSDVDDPAYHGANILLGNTPNPFSATTEIRYALPHAATVHMDVYDLNGRHIAVLVQDFQNAGTYTAVWNGRNVQGAEVPSGKYLYRLRLSRADGTVLSFSGDLVLLR